MITTEISPLIGAEITCTSPSMFTTAQTADETRRLLAHHGVVVFRDAHVGDADLVAFSKLLGDVVTAKVGGLQDYPEVSPITLDPAKSELAGLRRSTVFWHVDGLTDDVPQKAALLAARELADDGGDTEFANTYAAYEALPESRKAELSRYRVVHSFASAQSLVYPEATERDKAAWNRLPSREHPLIWKHRDGRHSLLVGATAGEVVGLSPDEGRALLDSVLEWATQPRFVLRHRWRVGDLVIWDNTGLLHRATPYEPTSRRLMHRTTLRGDEEVS